MKKSIAILFVLSSLMGCEVLEQTPESSFTPENFYKNADDARAAVSAVYDPLNSADMYNQVMWILQDQATDDAEWGGGRSTANQAKNDLDKYTFTPATSTFQSIWSTTYRGINRANTVISRVPTIPMPDDLKNRYVAEAKFMRAFYYFTLVRLFGGVPLQLQETTSLNNLNVARAPAEEVYKQIVQDFTDAEAVLPVSYTAGDRGRATKGAAKAFLAKVYLTRQEWAKASAKAKEVMDLGAGYDLWANFADVFSIANENGKESMFEIQAIGGGFGEGSWMQGYMRPNFDRVNGVAGFGDDPATENLYRAYRSDDRRRNVTIRLYSATSTPAAPASVLFPGYVAKYLDPTATANGEGGNNFPILRYADLLLMYAESRNEQAPNDAEAYAAINRVRNRAGIPNLTPNLSQAQFRDSLLLERRLELAFEGHRWYDLARTKRLISAMRAQNPTIKVEERHYLFPIPQTERDANPQLTQNEGY
ncbi:RagB/SusD family nutrient uptake outer membrane protein [Rudanella paleaurantiibacter]|uniref:RagB/SusD family nutrient uptake outer membrane protein n=1 Tax=Rudanella paleaurantiibacter TaxID=2614655 RepID=A0A7J5U1W5_9BACT|nr:RagB/SusD family nutrient uptake outer membrane protein [Rudanella paleaurantiibacter]KAB7731783.1 RagB/SusD family nutrient uptake outer membrane protein [Rudanella paleaurantiibacter]